MVVGTCGHGLGQVVGDVVGVGCGVEGECGNPVTFPCGGDDDSLVGGSDGTRRSRDGQ